MKKSNLVKGIQKLFNIDVREVSLVDRPAINEPFTEIKRKDGLGNKQEEIVMDEKQVKEAIATSIQAALAPLADTVKGIETRLEAQSTSIEEASKKTDELVSKSEEGAKSAVETLESIKKQVSEIEDETVKRFERIEGLVTKAKTQKIAGQDGDGDDKKSALKWPSLANGTR